MIETLALLLIMLWLLGLAAGCLFGSCLHVLLYVAVVMLLMRLIHGERI